MQNHPTYTDAVTSIQRYLRRIAESEPTRALLIVPVDGIYDTQTRNALSEFQRLRGLPVTGIVDKLTWDTLFIEYRALVDQKDTRISPDLFPAVPIDYETDFGENSAFILMLQFLLDELRIAYDTLPIFEQSGTFDMDTSLAVKEFQRINLLPVTGRVNRRTWNAIARAYNIYAR